MPIMEMMKEIQETCTKRGEASVFTRRLECLRLVEYVDTIKFKKAWINALDTECAIVSYSWRRPKNEPKVSGICFIEDHAGRTRRSKVRYSVWSRAVAYMLHNLVEYLWIDEECISQEESEAKSKAISEMDWLYHHGTHPFGMLNRPVKTEIQLHLLAQILQGEMLSEDAHGFLLKRGNTSRAWAAVQLLDEIISDIWWTRAWIYQENYHGGQWMDLLMPHERKLESMKVWHRDFFGTLRGELTIKSIWFSEALTDLCSAFIRSNRPEGQKGVAHRILSRAGRYSALLERGSSMSPTIIADVGKRGVANHPDRLAIIANCCSYVMRLDTNKPKKLYKNTCIVSLAILVMFLLNGEIFYEASRGTISPSELTVVEFIKRYAFEEFNPPLGKYELTFNKGCRFVEPCLKGDGVHTRGHLWRLWNRVIRIPCAQAKKWETVEKTLWGLQRCVERLEYDEELLRPGQEGFACRLKELLQVRTLQTPAEKYMGKMAEALADALHDGITLRLGYLCNSSDNTRFSPPTAVFICPDEAMDSRRPSFVFTSFRQKESDGPEHVSDFHKHVSLQVRVEDNGGLPPRLFARAWMNGLWFWTEPPQPVVFPLPRILREL